MFCAIFSKGKLRPSWNAKLQKIKTASYKKHSGTKFDQFQPMVLEILSFSCLCYFYKWPLAAILTGVFLFHFETNECKNHFDTNLVKIHYAIIEILSFSCIVLFLVTADGGILGTPNCKTSIPLQIRSILA